MIGSIKIELINWKYRPKAAKIINDLKSVTDKFAGINVEFIEKKDGPPKDRDIEIEIMNNNDHLLVKETSQIFQHLKKQLWIKNIDSNLNTPGIEWESRGPAYPRPADARLRCRRSKS